MTKQYEMPGRINRRSRFCTLFTAPDLVRVSLPLAIAYFVIGPTLAGMEMAAVYTAAATVGVIWWLGKPFSQHLDTLVYHVVRWLLAKRGIEGPDIEEIELGYAITADEAAVAGCRQRQLPPVLALLDIRRQHDVPCRGGTPEGADHSPV